MRQDIVEIGKRMKEIRERLGYTQEEFAEILGCVARTYAGYERGERRQPHELLQKIAKLGNTSVGYLVAGEKYVELSPELELKLKKVLSAMEEFKEAVEKYYVKPVEK